MSFLGFGRDPRSFEVVIYEEDYKELCAWVLKKPNIETGGDLFGLWADKYTAVIQLVLGPGQGCRRSSVSFYQDINYLERVGSYLTQKEGVCHIGEWHSHHQLGLARPSGGDENTVWNNMPTYNLKRFVIFIANIQKSSKLNYNVDIGCFLFEIDDQGRQQRVLPGTFAIMQKENPFSRKMELLEKRKNGAEEDDCKIAIEDVKLEVKKGGKSPSVTYMKKTPAAQNKKRDRLGNNPPRDKANDGETSGATTSKKQKVKNDGSVHNTGDGISESGNISPVSPQARKQLQKLKIDDDAQQQEDDDDDDDEDDDEQDDEEDEQQQQERQQQQDDKQDDERQQQDEQQQQQQQQQDERHQQDDEQQQDAERQQDDEQQQQQQQDKQGDEQQQQGEQQQQQQDERHQQDDEQQQDAERQQDDEQQQDDKQGDEQQQQGEQQQQQQQQQDKSKGEENKEGTAHFGEVNKEARPRQGEQGKPGKKSDTKEPRPLPKLEKEKTPATKPGKKSDTKESARPAPRPLPKLEKEKTPVTKTGKQKLQVTVTAKKTAEQSKGKKDGKKGKQQK